MEEYKMKFDNLDDVRRAFCAANAFSCIGFDCPLSPSNIGTTCSEFVRNNPDKAAELMGIEVIKKKYKPRLSDKEIEICKMLGAKWICRNDSSSSLVMLFKSKPEEDSQTEKGVKKRFYNLPDEEYIASMSSEIFPSVKQGDCISIY